MERQIFSVGDDMPIIASDIEHRNSKSGAAADGEATGDGLGGYMSSDVITDDTVENLFDNVTSQESEVGDTEYRAFFILNDHATLTYEACRVYLYDNYPMCALTTQLENGGSEVTVDVDDNENFPDTGAFFCEDEEIAYTGKTGTTAFTGCTRGSNSTSKVEHTVGKKCEHNKLSFCTEDPGTPNTNPIQTIGNESTEPSNGETAWSQARLYADGDVIGDLAPSEKYGVWLKRQVPVGAQAKSGIYVTARVKGDTQE
ncbi:hypothetical protein D4R42_04195 [bacterium]|nr:MAG: hypothetical protein D4R42_04195 [bacterium]